MSLGDATGKVAGDRYQVGSGEIILQDIAKDIANFFVKTDDKLLLAPCPQTGINHLACLATVSMIVTPSDYYPIANLYIGFCCLVGSRRD